MSLSENRTFQDIQVNVLNEIFETLNKDNRRYCILRNFEDLPFYIGNDVDFLISKNQKLAISKTIISVMVKYGFEISYKTERFGHLGLYFYHNLFKKTIIIDLLTRCSKIWYEYADVEYILNNVNKYKNFYVPQSGAILYTVVLKDILTYGKVRYKNQSLIDNVTMDEKEDFVHSGKAFLPISKLEKLFEQLYKKEVNITKRELFYQLQLKFLLSNMILYIYYRLKERLVK